MSRLGDLKHDSDSAGRLKTCGMKTQPQKLSSPIDLGTSQTPPRGPKDRVHFSLLNSPDGLFYPDSGSLELRSIPIWIMRLSDIEVA